MPEHHVNSTLVYASPQFNARWEGVWEAEYTTSMISFHNTCQGLNMAFLSIADCHMIFRRGSVGIVGVNKCGEDAAIPVDMNGSVLWWDQDYVE